jgi:hypothetical protein
MASGLEGRVACGVNQRAYFNGEVGFCYPAAWTVTHDGPDEDDRRFSRVQMIAPRRNEVIQVRFRIGAGTVNSDGNVLLRFANHHCQNALGLGDLPSPAASSGGLYVKSFVRRGVSDQSECIGSTISEPPPPGVYAWRQYLSPHLAHVEYAHQSAVPRTRSYTSGIAAADVSGYLGTLDAWNLIVRTLTFASVGAAPAPSLTGRWERSGHGLVLNRGRFTEYYFGSSVTPLPERHGTYTVSAGRIGFAYDGTGILKGRLPDNCAYAVGPTTLTICGDTYNRHP